MKIKWYKYTRKDALIVSILLTAKGFENQIVGGINSKGHSNHDIDLYLPNTEPTHENYIKIAQCLCMLPNRGNYNFTVTEVGGCYYRSEIFGHIDIFFKPHTKEYVEKFWKENE